ncbi:spermatogenesis-associated protein 4 [Phlyctochytrium planicorne]|nr:spermatogenesis-associated protein 4 [Phlyctochytrium planicorne]
MSSVGSREVLKWVQGLNLSFSIKNSKRDLANGFLIAEILSRYYPETVQMHAYDTGSGPAAKKNNWELLERAFVKLGIPVPRDYAGDVASMKNEAGALVLSIIHVHVNRKGSIGKPKLDKKSSTLSEITDPAEWLIKTPHLKSNLKGPNSIGKSVSDTMILPADQPDPKTFINFSHSTESMDMLSKSQAEQSSPTSKHNRTPSKNVSHGSDQAKTVALSPQAKDSSKSETIVMANPKVAAQILQSSQTNSEQTKEFEEHMGKVTKLL